MSCDATDASLEQVPVRFGANHVAPLIVGPAHPN